MVLERIRWLTGDGLREDMLEHCLLLQVNDDLDEMYIQRNAYITHVNVCVDVYIISTEHPGSVPQLYALIHTHVQLLKS